MALALPPEAWQKAQQLKEAGPFDYYSLTPTQNELLENAWQALYPGNPYPCATRRCAGLIREAHRQLLAELQYHLSQERLAISQPPITTPVDSFNSNPNGSPAASSTTPADNANTTPTAKTSDVGSVYEPAANKPKGSPSSRYQFAKGVTEVREFGNPIAHTLVTDELVNRLLGVSPDYARLFIDNEEAEAEALVDRAVEAQNKALLGGTPQDNANGNNAAKLPSPSALRQMNKDDVSSQYRQELQVDAVPAELDTNAKVAAAIIEYREKQAE